MSRTSFVMEDILIVCMYFFCDRAVPVHEHIGFLASKLISLAVLGTAGTVIGDLTHASSPLTARSVPIYSRKRSPWHPLSSGTTFAAKSVSPYGMEPRKTLDFPTYTRTVHTGQSELGVHSSTGGKRPSQRSRS